MKYLGPISDNKDLVTKEYVDDSTTLEYPYTEVEWVESNGKQFVYLDWKPPIATWGFSADFIVRNVFSTPASAWNPSTNVNGYGCIFGTAYETNTNDTGISTYTSAGTFHAGGAATAAVGFKTDQTRQTMSYIGTTFTKPNGTTMNIARVNEVANKPCANMVVFAKHLGLRRSGSGNVNYPSTTRIYSLKFYESTTVKVDLVGAIRKRDKVTGLYDKISKHFYPAPGMTYGTEIGDIGEKKDLKESTFQAPVQVVVNNITNTRMWEANAPYLNSLEDGQKISVIPLYAVSASYQTTELAGWDDTGNNSYVYLKLTLANGSTTDWIPCYYSNYGRLTTHYGGGLPLWFTYRENAFAGATETSGGYTIMRAFYADANYDSNTTPTFLYHYNNILARSAITAESLCVGDSTGFARVASGVTFDISYPLIWVTTAMNAGATQYAYNFLCHYDRNIATGAKTGYTSLKNKVQYLVVTISGNIATVDSTIVTDTLPTTDDGKVYITLGKLGNQSTGANYFIFYPEHPMFWYKNGAVRTYGDYGYTATDSATTGISIAAHGTGTVIGVQSTTTTASKVTVGSHSTDYGVKAAGSASTWTFEEKTIPNVTSAGTASSWTFEEKTIPNVTAAGSGSASLTFAMDTTDTKKLKITFSHTHTAPTIGTAIKVQSKSGGSNGTAPTLGTAIKVQSKSGGANGSAPTLGSKVPTVSASDVTVPIKNSSASTFVTGTTHTVTDNGHTHTI